MWRSLIGFGVCLIALVFVCVPAGAQTSKPSDGWNLHIDAKLHFPGKPGMIAHHW